MNKNLTLPLTESAWSALVRRSKAQRRTPKLQALYELENALGVSVERSEDTGQGANQSPVSSVQTA